MSKEVSVFCDTSVPLREILNAIEKTLQVEFMMRKIEDIGVVFECAYNFSVIIAFECHGLEDDGGIEFTKYPVEIDFLSERLEIDLLEEADKVAKQLSGQFQCTTIVVSGRVAGALDQVSIEIRRSWPQSGAALVPWRLLISSGICLRLLLACGSSLLERPSHPAGSSKQQWAILILLKRHQDGTQGQCELKEG